jgi:hypothetical protein
MLRQGMQIAMWVVVGPVLLVAGACLFILDQLLPRYLLAAALVAPFALAAHYFSNVSLRPFIIAVVVLGTVLAGLWENCDMVSGRSLLSLLFWSGRSLLRLLFCWPTRERGTDGP